MFFLGGLAGAVVCLLAIGLTWIAKKYIKKNKKVSILPCGSWRDVSKYH